MCYIACTICINISKCMYFLYSRGFDPLYECTPMMAWNIFGFASDSSWQKLILSLKQISLA